MRLPSPYNASFISIVMFGQLDLTAALITSATLRAIKPPGHGTSSHLISTVTTQNKLCLFQSTTLPEKGPATCIGVARKPGAMTLSFAACMASLAPW